MEINISKFFEECAPMDYSASVAEIGQDAGRATWSAACDDAPDYDHLNTEEKREAFRAHVGDFGAWSDDEIAAWSDDEIAALFLQMVAGDIREAGLDTSAPDWVEYENGAEAGAHAGRIFRGDDGQIYYYVGN